MILEINNNFINNSKKNGNYKYMGVKVEKIIEININNKYDLIDRYNEKKLSNKLLKYIIDETILTKRNNKIKIIINKKINIDIDSVELIKKGLQEEYNKSIEERSRNNMKQVIFLLLGMFFIFIATRIEKRGMWREIILITGWVPIWEMVKIELFSDVYGRRKRKIIKRLLESKIIELN